VRGNGVDEAGVTAAWIGCRDLFKGSVTGWPCHPLSVFLINSYIWAYLINVLKYI